jgi:hypothetical protein
MGDVTMMARDFMNAVARGEVDILQILLTILDQIKASYCVIGGLAVNAYAEPVVSLDLDLVVVSGDIARISEAAESRGLAVQQFEHSVNLSLVGSDLRIQLRTDPRYQAFLARARKQTVLGYEMTVASLSDVVQGKIWAYADPTRRQSKRQKDLADIVRLVETHPELETQLPGHVLSKLE